MNNGFNGSVKVITDKGRQRFDSFADGEQVLVKGQNGSWINGVVKKHKAQKCKKITFYAKYNMIDSQTFNIVCGADQDYVVESGNVAQVNEGDKLSFDLLPELSFDDVKLAQAYCYGYFYGVKKEKGLFGVDKIAGYCARIPRQNTPALLMASKAGYVNLYTYDEEYEFFVQTNDVIPCAKEDIKFLSAEEKSYIFYGMLQSFKDRHLDPTRTDSLAYATAPEDSDLVDMIADVAGYYVIKIKVREVVGRHVAVFMLRDVSKPYFKWEVKAIEDAEDCDTYNIACDTQSVYMLQGGIATVSEVK